MSSRWGPCSSVSRRVHGDAPLVEEDGDDGLRLTTRGGRPRRTLGRRHPGEDHAGDRWWSRRPTATPCPAVRGGQPRAVGWPCPSTRRCATTRSTTSWPTRGPPSWSRHGRLDGGEPVDAVPAEPDDVAALFYTSGTTGQAQGRRAHPPALVGQAGRRRAVADAPAARRSRPRPARRPHHGLRRCCWAWRCAGIPVYLLPKFRPDEALDAIEQRRATDLHRRAGDVPHDGRGGRRGARPPSVRLWASGADAMPFELARKFQRMGATATLPFIGAGGRGRVRRGLRHGRARRWRGRQGVAAAARLGRRRARRLPAARLQDAGWSTTTATRSRAARSASCR